jgi:lipopolysaccharide transport system ATP-binding protein
MSSELAIRAQGIGKDYRLGELTDVRRFLRTRLAPETKASRYRRDFQALDGVTFEIRPGESVAVIGTNGSGKSTLLQVMAGITVPTSGRMEIEGRLLPLLEIGAGFHSELTGLENVTLFGTVLGLTAKEIRDALPAISAFGEIDEAHMNTPLKRFSSGMQARLSFAIAMSFPADIFIFDEVMAVVDDHFRMIATAEIKRLHERGKTVVFVSHDMDQVRRVSERGLWLDRGRLVMDAPIDEVAAAYAEAQDDEAVSSPAAGSA